MKKNMMFVSAPMQQTIIYTMALFVALATLSLSYAQDTDPGDDLFNSSLNGFVPAGGSSFLGAIVQPNAANGDLDLIVLGEAQDSSFDAVLTVRFDDPASAIVASNDDFNGALNDFGEGNLAQARSCLINSLGFNTRLRPQDALVLVSVPGNSDFSPRSVFVEVTEAFGAAGVVNLQILQVDGFAIPNALNNQGIQCPDF